MIHSVPKCFFSIARVFFRLVHSSLYLLASFAIYPSLFPPPAMPSIPSIPSLFGNKGHSQSNRSSLTPSPSSTSINSRPKISAPLPAGRTPPSYPRVSSSGVTVQLIPIERGAAELNNNNDANPSSASPTSSFLPATRKLLHRDRDRERQQGGPPSPQPENSTSGVSRRSSLLGRSKPAPNPPQQYRQSENDNLDPYLQQSSILTPSSSGGVSRPQSMLPSPLESETDTTYSINSTDIDLVQHQHQNNYTHEGYQHSNSGSLEQQHVQYYDQAPQQYHQDNRQSQHHMMPPQPHNNPSRRSMDASHQSGPPGPPSREVSGLAGQQIYVSQQGGRGVDQQAYQTHGVGSGGGQPQPGYDLAKFEGQSMGRVMTPEQSRVDPRASQAPEAINIQVLLQDHDILRTCILKLYFFP